MTKMRVPDSFEEAALETVRLLSAQEAAKVAGLSPQTLRDYSDADRPGRPTLQTALALDTSCYEQTGRAPFFESYTRQLAARTRRSTRPVGDVLVEALDLRARSAGFSISSAAAAPWNRRAGAASALPKAVRS